MNNYGCTVGFGIVIMLLTACNQTSKPTASESQATASQANSNQSVSSTNQLNKITNNSNTAITTDSSIANRNLPILGKQAVQIFYENCVVTAGDSQKITEQAQKTQLFELSNKQKQAFNLSAEHVWGVNTVEGGQYLVETTKNMCAVKAHYADETTVRAEAQKMITQTAQQLGLTSQLVSDRENVNQLPIKELVYILQKANAPSQYVVTVYTSMSDKTPIKAALNFRLIPMK